MACWRFHILLVCACCALSAGALGESGGEGPTTATTPLLPRRVVSFAPSVTEAIFALGMGHRVVGVSSWCKYPPEAATRVSCGGEYNPNFEKIVSVRPDLVIVLGRAGKVREFCRKKDLPVLGVTMNTMATIRSDLLAIGKALGAEKEAKALCAKIQGEFDAVRSLAAARQKGAGEPPRVFVSIGRPEGSMGTLLTAGGGTFLDEMVALAGGVNVFADEERPYPTVSKESLVRRRPDVIIELRPGERIDAKKRAQLTADWKPLRSLPAVKTGRIVFLTCDFLQVPGPRVGQTARAVYEALHGGPAPPEKK